MTRQEALAEIAYAKLLKHQERCGVCTRQGLNVDGYCRPGRFLYYEWDRAERKLKINKTSHIKVV